ncbi:MAG: HNH endonuclease, partial [Okeania sp. SIO2D1]|nr:HNH endonuclease [Okeania sp. SIO2D1]
LTEKKQYLLKQQKGKCNYCKNDFHILNIETMEIDHIKPKSLGVTNDWSNFQLLHGHCHDTKTAKDGGQMKKSKQNASRESKDFT